MGNEFVLAVLFGVVTFIGLWVLINPKQYLVWIKSARPSLNLDTNDPRALTTAKFIGACFVVVPILFFVATLYERYRR
jgi:hypothetical protein